MIRKRRRNGRMDRGRDNQVKEKTRRTEKKKIM